MYNNHITIDVIHESKGVNGCLPINKVGCVFLHLTIMLQYVKYVFLIYYAI